MKIKTMMHADKVFSIAIHIILNFYTLHVSVEKLLIPSFHTVFPMELLSIHNNFY